MAFVKLRRPRRLIILIVIAILLSIQLFLLMRTTNFTVLKLQWMNFSTGNFFNRFFRPSSLKPFETIKPFCPVVPPGLKGRQHIMKKVLSFHQLDVLYSNLHPGGHYEPLGCRAQYKVAIIIPYRDREPHLKIFLHNIHPLLQRQQMNYMLFIVEMVPEVTFNRAIMLNIGFTEALKLFPFDCFIFHDVDLIPEDDRNLYSCPDTPRHMSGAIDKFKYKLPYKTIFGGVSAMRTEHFRMVNGFSNCYFGWGGEDDNMYDRISKHNLTLSRYNLELARYKMLGHSKEKPNPDRFKLLNSAQHDDRTDGLNSLKYELVKLEFRKLYTWVLVRVNEKEILGYR